ncbi:MAG: hypothetical protein V4754_19315 [Pseudomonadota bacterium]
MEAIANEKIDNGHASAVAVQPAPVRALRQLLQPKGSCWYCEKSLDAVRRFCGKSCAESFDEEAGYTR